MKLLALFFALAAAVTLNAHAGTRSARSPSDLVPPGYKLVETVHGDLDGDGKEDAILLVQATRKTKRSVDPSGAPVDRNRQGVVIAFKNGPGYTLALANLTCFSSADEDGGVYMPPSLDLSVHRGSLIVHKSHGKYGHETLAFRLQKDDFQLIGYDRSDNDGPVVRKQVSVNLLTGQRITRINAESPDDEGNDTFREETKSVSRGPVIWLSRVLDFDKLFLRLQLRF